MTEAASDLGRPAWDSVTASSLRDAIVLVGITYVDRGDKPLEQLQFFGIVTKVEETAGIALTVQSETYRGQVYWLPPHLAAFTLARPGTYRLRSTGEELVDPDYVTSWRIVKPENQPQ